MNITLRQLQVFREVAQSGSITQAARQLHLTQPAVSMQIKQLESSIDQELFRKKGRGLALTDAGYEILELSRRLLEQVNETSERLQLISEGHLGQLHLVVASTVSAVATRLMALFKADFPDTQIRFEVTNRAGLIDHLQRGDADLVLMGKPPEGLPIKSLLFMGNPLVVIGSPDHPLARGGQPVSLEDLQHYGFVMREPDSGTRQAVERSFHIQGSLDSSMEMNSNEAIKQAVEAGLGLGVVSLHTLVKELQEGRLCLIESEGFPILRSWYIVQRIDKILSPLALHFRRHVLLKAPLLGNNLPHHETLNIFEPS